MRTLLIGPPEGSARQLEYESDSQGILQTKVLPSLLSKTGWRGCTVLQLHIDLILSDSPPPSLLLTHLLNPPPLCPYSHSEVAVYSYTITGILHRYCIKPFNIDCVFFGGGSAVNHTTICIHHFTAEHAELHTGKRPGSCANLQWSLYPDLFFAWLQKNCKKIRSVFYIFYAC